MTTKMTMSEAWAEMRRLFPEERYLALDCSAFREDGVCDFYWRASAGQRSARCDSLDRLLTVACNWAEDDKLAQIEKGLYVDREMARTDDNEKLRDVAKAIDPPVAHDELKRKLAAKTAYDKAYDEWEKGER